MNGIKLRSSASYQTISRSGHLPIQAPFPSVTVALQKRSLTHVWTGEVNRSLAFAMWKWHECHRYQDEDNSAKCKCFTLFLLEPWDLIDSTIDLKTSCGKSCSTSMFILEYVSKTPNSQRSCITSATKIVFLKVHDLFLFSVCSMNRNS